LGRLDEGGGRCNRENCPCKRFTWQSFIFKH
jgi:hypothetical protein